MICSDDDDDSKALEEAKGKRKGREKKAVSRALVTEIMHVSLWKSRNERKESWRKGKGKKERKGKRTIPIVSALAASTQRELLCLCGRGC